MPTKDGKKKPKMPVGVKQPKADPQIKKANKAKDVPHREMTVGLDEKLNKVKANQKEKMDNKNIRSKTKKEKY